MKIIQEANNIRRHISTAQMRLTDMKNYLEELQAKNCPEETKLSILIETIDYIKSHLDEVEE